MRIVLQRVSHASVDVDGKRVAMIGQGILLLVGVAGTDSDVDFATLARKVVDLRIFEDESGKMNRSLRDMGGGVLAVSQFTLYADVTKGRRPSFGYAAAPDLALPIFNRFVDALKAENVDVQTGIFGAKMAVHLENDGPVTLVLEVAAPEVTG